MSTVTMRQLLEAGIHFGHQTRRWNPKMQRYIFGQRNGIYIIDLQKTMQQLRQAYIAVRNTVARGGNVLFVGTKKQAQEAARREAERCGMYYINTRWLGGTLTNWQTIRKSIQRLLELDEMESSGRIDQYSKKEAIQLRKDREKLEKGLSGIKAMPGPPRVLFVVDAKKETIAVREAKRLGITSIGIVDTNCDPDEVDIAIPGNDDALRAVGLFCSVIADAVLDGKLMGEKGSVADMRSAKGEDMAPAEMLIEPAAAAGEDPEGNDDVEAVVAADWKE